MEIPLRHLEALFKKTPFKKLYFDLSDLTQVNTFQIEGKEIGFQSHIDIDYLEKIRTKQVEKVSVCVGKDCLNALRELFPTSYLPFQFEENIPTLRNRMEFVERMNKLSKKRRELVLMEEIVAKDAGDKERVIFKMNTVITENVFKKISLVLGEWEKIQCSYNEEGILVYVANPVENVKLRIDILALLSRSRFPIYNAESVADAIDIFYTKRPKLVILSHLEKAWESKEIYLTCLKADPFFHYVVYNESPSSAREEEYAKIQKIYNDDYQDSLDLFNGDKTKSKPLLEGAMKKPILDKIEIIRNNFSRKNFIEMQYYLHRLGARFNVTTLENILNKISR